MTSTLSEARVLHTVVGNAHCQPWGSLSWWDVLYRTNENKGGCGLHPSCLEIGLTQHIKQVVITISPGLDLRQCLNGHEVLCIF